MRILLPLLAALGLALAVVGCGDSSSGAANANTPPIPAVNDPRTAQ